MEYSVGFWSMFLIYFAIVQLVTVGGQEESDVPPENDLRILPPVAQEPSIEGAFPWEQSGYLQGDIIFKPGTRNGLRNTQQYWTRAIVPYYIDNSFTPAEKKVIRGGIDEYHNRTCIRFRPYKKGDTNWVEFKSNKLGCFSSDIGMKKNGAQVINLQHKNKLGGGCIFHGTVVHEIMHALGFYHQQSASDRDQYVTVHLENVKSGHEHNFDKEGPNVVTDFGVAYDYQSIMHYSNYAFSKNKLPTLKPKNGNFPLGQDKQLSPKDLAKIAAMYKRECARRN